MEFLPSLFSYPILSRDIIEQPNQLHSKYTYIHMYDMEY